MIKKITLIILLILAGLMVKSQDTIMVYKDYQSYKEKTGDSYDEYRGWMHVGSKVSILLTNHSKKSSVKCKDIWGFTYNRVLFRVMPGGRAFVALISKGKICYYENGFAHAFLIGNTSGSQTFSLGTYCYVSKSIRSEIVPLPLRKGSRRLNKFIEENPKYQKLFEEIGENFDYQWIREKVEEFEAEN